MWKQPISESKTKILKLLEKEEDTVSLKILLYLILNLTAEKYR